MLLEKKAKAWLEIKNSLVERTFFLTNLNDYFYGNLILSALDEVTFMDLPRYINVCRLVMIF